MFEHYQPIHSIQYIPGGANSILGRHVQIPRYGQTEPAPFKSGSSSCFWSH
jgi:hypothetical protein